MERKLASIQEIIDVQPIEGADLIQVATVKGWKLVIKKGEFAIGDKAVYCEIDSFLPLKEEFEFLRKSSYKKMGDHEGFRLKTVKLRGQVSQGLLLPISLLDGITDATPGIGDDVSELLGIVKYEPPIPASLAGTMKAYFPSFIPKTDEERVQNLSAEYEGFRSKMFYTTEKLDGSSITFYYNDGEFGVCSRNIDLLETADNTLWKMAREYKIEDKLKAQGNIALQGELIGDSIQGNPYKLRGQEVRFFNAFDIDQQRRYDYNAFVALVKQLELATVPIVDDEFTLPATIDELLLMADGNSLLHPSAQREGLVFRSHDMSISFKAISNTWLLKSEQ